MTSVEVMSVVVTCVPQWRAAAARGAGRARAAAGTARRRRRPAPPAARPPRAARTERTNINHK